MLPCKILVAVLLATSAAVAQEADRPLIDFTLRPAQAIDDDPSDDIWNWDTEPVEPPPLEREIGPPLAGPTGDEPFGPLLAGPHPLPAEQRIRLSRPGAPSDPFAAIGFRLGSFVIRPAIEIGVGATDNADGSSAKTAVVGLVIAPEINIRSADDRHEIEADFRAEGIFYDKDEFDERTAQARLRARYDLTSRTSVAAEAGYSFYLEDFSDPETPDDAAERPSVQSLDATLGVEQRFGRFSTRVSGFADRTVHEDVALAGGGTAARDELDNTEYGMRVRTGYRAGGTLSPFAEVAVGRRDFDREADDGGFERSSLWGELVGGIVIDRGSKLSGELSLGYRREDLEDGRLEDIEVLLANAALLWSPRRLTEVRFDLTTETTVTNVPEVSGTVLYSGTLAVARSLTPRIRVEGGAGLDYERPIGDDWRDLTFTGFARASYAFSRTTSLQARYIYERTESTEPDGDSDAHEISLRVRIQR